MFSNRLSDSHIRQVTDVNGILGAFALKICEVGWTRERVANLAFISKDIAVSCYVNAKLFWNNIYI